MCGCVWCWLILVFHSWLALKHCLHCIAVSESIVLSGSTPENIDTSKESSFTLKLQFQSCDIALKFPVHILSRGKLPCCLTGTVG